MKKTTALPEGRVSGLFISRAKGAPREALARGFFRVDHGLEGDAWSGPGDRQVLLLSEEARRAVTEDPREGLCFARFKETLQVEGFPLAELPVGGRFQAGGAVFETAAKGKRCFPECGIIRDGGPCCALKGAALFARVVREGFTGPGDPVRALP